MSRDALVAYDPQMDGGNSPEQRRSNTTLRAAVTTALIFAVAFNLRPAMTAVGSVLPQLGADLQLSEGVQGTLGAVPLVALALISPLVHHPARRFGVERALMAALIGIVLGVLLRSYGGGLGLWAGTAVLGCAVAVGNVLVPTVLKRDYAGKVARATGIYSACMTIGAAIASVIAVPMSEVVGWRGALAFWAIPAALVALLWLPRTRAAARPVEEPEPVSGRPVSVWRQPTAWLVTAFMGLQSTHFFVVATWLPTIGLAIGRTPQESGVLLFVFQLAALVGVFTAPRLVRGTNVLPAALAASIPMLIGLVGLIALPQLALGWVLIAGAGSGASLVAGLTLISLRGRDQQETTQLSGMAQSIGYLLAAVGPIGAGFMAEWTGGWTASLGMLTAMATVQLIVAFAVGKDRRVRT
ncbi:CynX/NimT family MFS transporter [Enemella sp. A6]|uniref:CynX/NimT family MFS transporter n=1 Tax=Enemella sp. A6 TaxID=3440152 RepID=UPI003EB97027